MMQKWLKREDLVTTRSSSAENCHYNWNLCGFYMHMLWSPLHNSVIQCLVSQAGVCGCRSDMDEVSLITVCMCVCVGLGWKSQHK